MFIDAANETRPVGRNRRGFLKELGFSLSGFIHVH